MSRQHMKFGQGFPLFAKFVCRYTIPINHPYAPNLVHLALEQWYNPIVKSTLDMLRGCPLLETLITHWSGYPDPTHDHSCLSSTPTRHRAGRSRGPIRADNLPPISPKCRGEFRTLFVLDICGEISSSVMAMIQHVLRVDIAVSRLQLCHFPSSTRTSFVSRGRGAPSKQRSPVVTMHNFGTFSSAKEGCYFLIRLASKT